MWSVTVWKETSTEDGRESEFEGVVPSNWIHASGKHLFWPPGFSAEKALKERRNPNENWKQFPIKKIKFESDSFKEAEEHMYDNSTSLDESGEEGDVIGKRQSKKRRYEGYIIPGEDDFSVEADAMETDEYEEHQHEGIQKDSGESSGNEWSEDEQAQMQEKVRPRHGQKARSSRSPAVDGASRKQSGYPLSEESSTIARSSRSPAADGASRKQSGYPLSEEKFQKRVIFLLCKISDRLDQLEQKVPAELGADEDDDFQRCNTMEDFNHLQKLFTDEPETRKKLVQKLARIGGSDLRDNVVRVMDRVMTKACMSLFNMEGCRKGEKAKCGFKKQPMFHVIVESIMACRQGAAGLTEELVEQSIKNVLKYAPWRKEIR